VEGFTPNTQIREHDTKYELVFEVPGFKRTDISVKTDNGVLLVTGEITDTLGGELLRANYDVSEGKFETSWNIPEEIEVEKISAKVTDGILTVWLPKVEKARPKNIEVQ
jgi:HSP20 family protein